MSATERPAPASLAQYCAETAAQSPVLTTEERAALGHLAGLDHQVIHERNRVALARLIDPLKAVSARWGNALTHSARNMLLMEVGRRSLAYWAWDEQTWTEFVASVTGEIRHRRRAHLVAWGYLFGGHRRLHHRVQMPKLRPPADFVFGHGAVDPALEQVCTLLERWETSPKSQPELVRSSVLDALLSAGSPRLKDVTLELLQDLVADHPASSARRRGFFKMSRVLAANCFIPERLTGSHQQRGTRPETLASVPPEWLEMVLLWRKFSTNELGTIRTKFPLLLVAGRWAAERHPEATSPQAWTRDIAAEYIADTVIAVRGQWAGHNRNRTGWGEPLNASGKAGRVDTIRSFFCDLIEWEWITPRFDPRRVLALPLSVRAGRDPDPRIIDDAAWAKLMAAGLTLTSDDLRAYGTPRAKAAGWHANYYPIQMIRALIGVWLFGGLRRLCSPDLRTTTSLLVTRGRVVISSVSWKTRMVSSLRWAVTTWRAWPRPSWMRCPATTKPPVLLTVRSATCSPGGGSSGGGPSGRPAARHHHPTAPTTQRSPRGFRRGSFAACPVSTRDASQESEGRRPHPRQPPCPPRPLPRRVTGQFGLRTSSRPSWISSTPHQGPSS